MLTMKLNSDQATHGQSRRAFLRDATLGTIGLTMSNQSIAGAALRDTSLPARAVIMLWLWGGPSHLDTFDMKPDAPLEYRGPFEPIATTVPGIQSLRVVSWSGAASRSIRAACGPCTMSRTITASRERSA